MNFSNFVFGGFNGKSNFEMIAMIGKIWLNKSNRMKWLQITTCYQDIRGVAFIMCKRGNELLHVKHFRHIKKCWREMISSINMNIEYMNINTFQAK